MSDEPRYVWIRTEIAGLETSRPFKPRLQRYVLLKETPKQIVVLWLGNELRLAKKADGRHIFYSEQAALEHLEETRRQRYEKALKDLAATENPITSLAGIVTIEPHELTKFGRNDDGTLKV